MALAIAAPLEEYDEELKGRVKLKWINDIYVDGKKVAGILCKSSNTVDGHIEMIAGLGVNLNSCPDNQSMPTTCLSEFIKEKVNVDDFIEKLQSKLCHNT